MEFGIHIQLVNCCFIIIAFFTILMSECKTSVLCPKTLRGIVEKYGCDLIKCESGFSESNCTVGESVYEEKLTFCGCCPGCAKYKGWNPDFPNGPGEDDSNTDYLCDPDFDPSPLDLEYEDCDRLYCPVIKNCKPGLLCKTSADSISRCELPAKPYPKCQNRCFLQKAIAEVPGSNWRWTPKCTADGYYEPLQMKGSRGNGDCYCMDKCGTRILGRSRWESDNCANQTCACSLHVHKLRTEDPISRIATLHCTDLGDYEPLQCDTDSSLCYCVDTKSGRVMGDVLPEHMWKNLPCYDRRAVNFAVGGNYLRLCESEWAAGQKLTREAKLHGLDFSIQDLDCEYDGSFKAVFKDRFNGQELCVNKEKTRLQYFRTLRTSSEMMCRCSSDTLYFASIGIQPSKDCEPETGNYKPAYFFGSYAQCVDDDGYSYGPQVPADFGCCLEVVNGEHTCPPEIADQCTTNYPPCSTYLFARDFFW